MQACASWNFLIAEEVALCGVGRCPSTNVFSKETIVEHDPTGRNGKSIARLARIDTPVRVMFLFITKHRGFNRKVAVDQPVQHGSVKRW